MIRTYVKTLSAPSVPPAELCLSWFAAATEVYGRLDMTVRIVDGIGTIRAEDFAEAFAEADDEIKSIQFEITTPDRSFTLYFNSEYSDKGKLRVECNDGAVFRRLLDQLSARLDSFVASHPNSVPVTIEEGSSGLPDRQPLPIKETQTIAIAHRVLTPHDIQGLVSLQMEALHDSVSTGRRYVRIEIQRRDGSSAEGSDISILESGILEEHRIESISVHANTETSTISLRLSHGDSPSAGYHNKLVVSGTDPMWVNGSIRQSEGLLARTQPQRQFSRLQQFVGLTCVSLLPSLALVLAGLFAVHKATYTLPNSGGTTNLHNWILVVITGLLLLLGGTIAAVGSLHGKIMAMYPSVELQTGPDHANEEERHRRILRYVLSIVIIPLITSFAVAEIVSLAS